MNSVLHHVYELAPRLAPSTLRPLRPIERTTSLYYYLLHKNIIYIYINYYTAVSNACAMLRICRLCLCVQYSIGKRATARPLNWSAAAVNSCNIKNAMRAMTRSVIIVRPRRAPAVLSSVQICALWRRALRAITWMCRRHLTSQAR